MGQEVRALLAVQTAALRRADQKPELHAEVQAVEVATRHQSCHLSEVGWAITRRRQRTSTLAWEQASFQCSPCRGQTIAAGQLTVDAPLSCHHLQEHHLLAFQVSPTRSSTIAMPVTIIVQGA